MMEGECDAAYCNVRKLQSILTIPFSSWYQKVAESSVVNFSAKCFPFCTVSGNSTSTPSPGRGLSSWRRNGDAVGIQCTMVLYGRDLA